MSWSRSVCDEGICKAKILSENAGLNAAHVLAGLSAANAQAGVDIEGGLDGTSDNSSGILVENGIFGYIVHQAQHVPFGD